MVQPLEQKDGDQGCPNLDAQGVFGGAHETLHFEVLLERLEEQLNLPTVFVDGGNSCGAKRQQDSVVFERSYCRVVRGFDFFVAAAFRTSAKYCCT